MMGLALANFPLAGGAGVAAGLLILSAGIAFGVHFYRSRRPSPAELERRRRGTLQASGKMGDANISELRDNLVFYSYNVRGIEYHATQDISDLAQLLPPDAWTAIGPVSMKYDPRNPANSMVLCEQWSGLRTAQPRN